MDIEKFQTKTVMVVGDIMIDSFVCGNSTRISPEAPMPVVKTEFIINKLGGAANVANNIVSLKGNCCLIGIVGKDPQAQELKQALEKAGISYKFLEGKQTTTKYRIVANNQYVARFDMETMDHPPVDKVEPILYSSIETHNPDIIVVSDYNKGMITMDIMDILKEISYRKNIAIVVDPKVPNMHLYNTVDIVTPNKHEAEEFCRSKGLETSHTETLAKYIQEYLNCKSVLITEGKDGMTLIDFLGNIYKIPARPQRMVYDVIGAGDTAIATLALCIASEISLEKAAEIANIAAGISVAKPSTATVTQSEIIDVMTAMAAEAERDL